MFFAALLVINFIDMSSENQGICYGDLGCFPITSDFFDPIYRPLNVNPQTPEEINTTFLLYTKKNPEDAQLIDRHHPITITNSNYDPKKPTKFITHGFILNAYSLINLTKAFIRSEDVNVIVVDWSKGAQRYSWNPELLTKYIQACANTRVVGREIGNLIKLLMENYQVNPDDIHLIGHSLGAHISGYAGQWMNETKLGQITGLDPAGPYFENMPTSIRVDPSDAKFVDAIHTDANTIPYTSFGIYEPSGHVDFYPDGGHVISECYDSTSILKFPIPSILKGIATNIICEHVKSVQIYEASVKKSCPFISYACKDFEAFKDAKCYNCDKPGYDCRPMGYYTNQYPYDGLWNKKYFLTTTKNKDYLCASHWILQMKISDEQSRVSGNIYLSAVGEKYNLTKQKLNRRTETFAPGKTYSYLVTFEQNPVKILSLQFSWTRSLVEYLSSLFSPDKLMVKELTLLPIDIIDQVEKNDRIETFCDSSLDNIEHDKVIAVMPKSNC